LSNNLAARSCEMSSIEVHTFHWIPFAMIFLFSFLPIFCQTYICFCDVKTFQFCPPCLRGNWSPIVLASCFSYGNTQNLTILCIRRTSERIGLLHISLSLASTWIALRTTFWNKKYICIRYLKLFSLRRSMMSKFLRLSKSPRKLQRGKERRQCDLIE
jgi:hypothetical protein